VDTAAEDRTASRAGARLTVQGWLAAVLAVMVVLVITGTVAGGLLLHRTAAVSDELLYGISPARVEAYRLQTALVNQETGLRGYLATGDAQFLRPYTEGRSGERHAAARIRSLTAGRAQQAADVAAIERAADRWRRTYAEPSIKRVTPGRPGTVDRAAAERGKAQFDHLRSLFAAQNRHLADVHGRSSAELGRIRTVRNWVLGAIVAVFLLTCLAVAVLLRRLVTRPLQRLSAASRTVAGGEFDHRIPADGPADVRALAKDVEAMRQTVVTALETARARRDALARQAAELDAQAVELRRSNAELEQFAYVASHDLQEPLRKVASFCQLLEKRYGDRLDERGTQYIAFAVDGAKRMQILINDLLTFSRVGRLNDARVPVPLDTALDKALANLATAIEESHARVERPERLPEITGDPTLLVMLWQNLVGNAVKFRHPDRPPVVRITCEPDPDGGDDAPAWRLCVSDNGIGIPEEFAEKVFVIFQRLHGRDAYSGTGIGLALCKKIVEFHGGRIWIDTAHTGGTRFCFTLHPSPDAGGPAPRADRSALEGSSA
jgi:signal transduction histidine kinase